jgi:hypothetical protein
VANVVRIAAAMALTWGTVELLVTLRGPEETWLPPGVAVEKRAASDRQAAAWRTQFESRRVPLEALRAALGREPHRAARRRAARRALDWLDSSRREKDLVDMANLRPAARRMEYSRRLRAVSWGSSANPREIGEALATLARLRKRDRTARPTTPLVLDEFRSQIIAWLVAGR